MPSPFPFRHFKTSPEIIRLPVMMYIRFPLSLRKVEDLLAATALGLAALVSAVVAFKSLKTPPYRANLFEAGVAVIFGGLALWSWSTGTGSGMTLTAAHLFTKLGLLVLILVGMAFGQPFTLVYAREQVDPAYRNSLKLLGVSQIIAGAWALAVALMIVGDLFLPGHPDPPQFLTFVVSLCGFAAAGAFILWFARQAKQTT